MLASFLVKTAFFDSLARFVIVVAPSSPLLCCARGCELRSQCGAISAEARTDSTYHCAASRCDRISRVAVTRGLHSKAASQSQMRQRLGGECEHVHSR